MFGAGKNIFKFFKSTEEGDFDFYFSDVTRITRSFEFNYWSPDWKLRRNLRSLVPGFFFVFYIFEAFYLAKDFRDDFDLMVKAISVAGPSLMFLVKVAMIFVNRDEIKSLISEIRDEFWNIDGVQAVLPAEGVRKRRPDDAMVAHSSKQDPAETTEGVVAKNLKKKLLLKGSRLMKMVIRLFLVQVVIIAVIYVAAPVIPMMLHSKFDTPFKLPLLGAFDSLFLG